VAPDAPQPERSRGWAGRIVLLVGAAVAVVLLVRVLADVDWEAVRHSVGRLAWWQPLVLAAVLLLRQVCNAAPLALFIPGVTLYRATLNDLGANALAAAAPPPADMALRVAMFRSWGVRASPALAGTTMNALTFFLVRFSAPVTGFVLAALTGHRIGLRWLDLVSVLIAVLILGGILLTVRTDTWARWVGIRAGRVTRAVRADVDPDRWADACVRFRGDIASTFGHAFPRAIGVTQIMLLADYLVLLLALRFVGVGAGTVSAAEVAVAFLFAFPLTALPVSGLGVVDALVLASVVESGGDDVQEPAIAALIVWRVLTLLGPLLMGFLATALWRRTLRTEREGARRHG
jgi:uncharacterized membrane protein YbhN (UPF0104 family)